MSVPKESIYKLEDVLVQGSNYGLYRLKLRLFKVGLKKSKCEECGWAQKSPDGRIPIELDHINSNRYDNRIENLRILCPNCHSLKPTHRGRNKGARRGGEIGRHATLKTL
ncbi:HNH endonuclease [Candidatus Kaiserbacteria bacterium]|nr:HNH endonuclease [Candidatus Kaiserbacteria bacterium]